MFNEVNKHLMMQLDRLTSIKDEDLAEELENEIQRSKAICGVVDRTVQVGLAVIEAHKVVNDYQLKGEILGIGTDKN